MFFFFKQFFNIYISIYIRIKYYFFFRINHFKKKIHYYHKNYHYEHYLNKLFVFTFSEQAKLLF